MENTSPRQLLFNVLGLAAVLGCLYLFFTYFDVSQVRHKVESAGIWAPLVFMVAKASTIVLAPLSGAPLYPVAGALFGFWKGFVYLVLGDMLGGSIAFFISRIFGRRIANHFLGNQKGFINDALDMMGSVRGFLFARLGFVTFPEIPAYAAGLSRIPFIPFLFIYTVIGLVPTAVTAALGALITDGNDSFVFMVTLIFGGAVSVVSITTFLYMVQKEVDKSKASKESELE